MSGTVDRRAGRDGGQASVELALVLPVVVVLVLAVVQVGLLARRQVLVTHVAREAVRAASVAEAGTDGSALGTGLAGGLDGGRLRVVAADAGAGHVRVEVTYVDPTDVAVVGALLPDVTLRAAAVMRREGGA